MPSMAKAADVLHRVGPESVPHTVIVTFVRSAEGSVQSNTFSEPTVPGAGSATGPDAVSEE